MLNPNLTPDQNRILIVLHNAAIPLTKRLISTQLGMGERDVGDALQHLRRCNLVQSMPNPHPYQGYRKALYYPIREDLTT